MGSYKGCPAWGKICIKCKKTGHFSKVCRFTQKVNYITHEEDESPAEFNSILCVGGTSCKNVPTCTVLIDGKEVSMMVDSCAWYSIIGKSIFNELWGAKELLPPDIQPGGYSGHKIDLEGFIWVDLEFMGRKTRGKLYIASKGVSILGWPHLKEMGIKLDPNASPSVYAITTNNEKIVKSIKNEFPKLFSDSLGKYADFEHKIILKDGAIPIRHKVRNVPLAYRGKLKEILADLVEKHIIEPIESSPWVSPIVLSLKSNGNLRLC